MSAPTVESVDPKIRQAVKEADERKAALAKLPPAGELLPGMLDNRRDYYMGQLWYLVTDMVDGPAHWWNETMLERERAFLCRIAKVDRKLAALAWREIDQPTRARIIAAFTWLYEWVQQFQPPISPFRPVAIDASP